jgi:SAM-dependent methyltransferase
VTGVDRSDGFLQTARQNVNDPRTEFKVGDAQSLPVDADTFDAAVSGLVLNFVPQPDRMIAEMRRAVKQNGTVAIYIWDYPGKMQLMRHFWNAAAALDPAARDLDEGRRFPLCAPQPLSELFVSSGLHGVDVRPLDVSTHFKDFDDFWLPFLGGQGPAAGYALSLDEERRAQLRERLYNSLPFAVDGSIQLVARAWAVRGMKW